MNKFFKVIFFPLTFICYILIYAYKFIISPILPKTCKYYPTCSSYMLLSIKEFGIIKGVFLGTKRICRCTPKRVGGLDFVPLNIKGDKKWIF